MDPVEALRETAFWLERERASTYRVEAFRKAAAALADLPADEIAERAHTGALGRMKGLGPRTTTVVEQALDGKVPAYLVDLRERNIEPLASGGAELRALLRGDLHSHSDWSDGGSPIEEMAAAAAWRGREYQAITDHSPRLTIANGLSRERLEVQLEVIADLDTRLDGLTLLTGIEVDIHLDGSLDQDDDLLDRLDVVVASVHSKLAMDAPSMTRRMVAAVSNPHTDVLGHCTGRLVEGGRGQRRQSQFDAEEVFRACADHGVAVEINSRPERQDPPDELIDLANELGCLFSIDTDAHAPGQLDFLDLGAARAAERGIDPDRIVTTWPLDRLRTWLVRSR
ncbi:PHP domain-containing protein [Aeromicrobium duanguangcaii]|uniref:PHP domain-containing protein n=1 Tax=Aeromicrobium duanguangcaii TaxID=2968086 RepID=A0ABY5KJX0_9ACTN|nr:PHP domain-containing protein [Aeromicrobium duanguangcaii]MCD9153454.1 PHP domain-containing protein [Aeromicrobium duanguangcaii]MCL3836559.1 PHP domain-containing protein [Aeromicrobium duanguangcaii]UUI69457.1 PHP domain-containing protein [Aeromicrobium duanguangcaii]